MPKRNQELIPGEVLAQNLEEAAFIKEVTKKPSQPLTESARRIGYKGSRPDGYAYRIIRRPEVQRRNKAALNAATASVERLIGARVLIAEGSIADVLTFNARTNTFRLDVRKAYRTGGIHNIQQISTDKYGQIKIKLYSRLEAYQQLDKIRGLIKLPVYATTEERTRAEIQAEIESIRERFGDAAAEAYLAALKDDEELCRYVM